MLGRRTGISRRSHPRPVITKLEKLTAVETRRIHVDKGYRRVQSPTEVSRVDHRRGGVSGDAPAPRTGEAGSRGLGQEPRTGETAGFVRASRRDFASFRSAVANPSVNRSQTSSRSAKASADRHWSRSNRARLVAARMSDFSELFTLSGKI